MDDSPTMFRSSQMDFWHVWRRRLLAIIYICAGTVADLFEGGFLREKSNVTFPPDDADRWTEEEILAKLPQAIPLEGSGDGPDNLTEVYRLDSATAVKYSNFHGEEPGTESEVLALKLVAERTTIPVPRVLAVVNKPRTQLLVMNCIEGQRLDRAWPALSWRAKLRVALTLRSYVRQLRRIQAPANTPPGPVGPVPRRCRGATFWDCAGGPFATRDAFFHYVRHYVFGIERDPRDPEPFLRADDPFVFTHHDLNMRNIILGADGKVWLVDFGWSGFYPVYYEYLSMAIAAQDVGGQKPIPPSWRILVPFIAGPYFEEGWNLCVCA